MGLDCYRTYEALLYGSWPIVKSSALDGIFDGLPVLILKDWRDLTREKMDLFEREWTRERLEGVEWEKLYTGYWWMEFRGRNAPSES